jgi:hypothetical protein
MARRRAALLGVVALAGALACEAGGPGLPVELPALNAFAYESLPEGPAVWMDAERLFEHFGSARAGARPLLPGPHGDAFKGMTGGVVAP